MIHGISPLFFPFFPSFLFFLYLEKVRSGAAATCRKRKVANELFFFLFPFFAFAMFIARSYCRGARKWGSQRANRVFFFFFFPFPPFFSPLPCRSPPCRLGGEVSRVEKGDFPFLPPFPLLGSRSRLPEDNAQKFRRSTQPLFLSFFSPLFSPPSFCMASTMLSVPSGKRVTWIREPRLKV